MERIFGLGLARVEGDHPIRMGYSHPSSHGGLRIHCEVEDEVIRAAQIEIGFMHRGVEALFAERDYRQGVMLASRHDWSGPSGGEIAYALAIEDLLGLTPPPRASWLRVFICELDRIVSALTFLSALPEPAIALIQRSMNQHREVLAYRLEKITGARMHHQVIKVGGVAVDVDEVDLSEIADSLSPISRDLDVWRDKLTSSLLKYRNVGVLDRENALSYGASGIIARASGVALDVRTSHPYATYGEVDALTKRAPKTDGDITARVTCLVDEVELSISIVERATQQLRESVGDPIEERTPKVLRLPEGEAYLNVEGCLGASGVALFSDGGRSPTRLRLRTASVGNLAALEPSLVGVKVLDLPMVLASWPFLTGDSDR